MKRQQGFTLIELIVVIVILGILAATALPKFLDISSDARKAALNGAAGAMSSAANLAHAAQLVAGSASNVSVTLGGATITMSGGYPTADTAGIMTAANISTNDWTIAGGQVDLKTTVASCNVVYANAGAGSFSVTPTLTGC